MRSSLTVLGIVIGVAAVILMVTLGNGATARVTSDISSLGANMLMVMPCQERRGMGGGMREEAKLFETADVDALRDEVPGVSFVAPTASKTMQVFRRPAHQQPHDRHPPRLAVFHGQLACRTAAAGAPQDSAPPGERLHGVGSAGVDQHAHRNHAPADHAAGRGGRREPAGGRHRHHEHHAGVGDQARTETDWPLPARGWDVSPCDQRQWQSNGPKETLEPEWPDRCACNRLGVHWRAGRAAG